MTELYRMSFVFNNIINEKEQIYWSTNCVVFKSANPSFIHEDKVSQHSHDSQTSWVTKALSAS